MNLLLILFPLVFAGVYTAALDNRIVGGTPTTIDQYPSLAQVESRTIFSSRWRQSCACSILNSRYVLSAAHCFAGLFYRPSFRRIRAGTSTRGIGGNVRYVEREFNHPSYGWNFQDGDISVIRLSDPFELGPLIQQGAILAQGIKVPDNTPLQVAGWGTTSSGGLPSQQLLEVTLYSINNDLCRERYENSPLGSIPVTPNMICAGILDVGGRDACQGDSGGPVYYSGTIVGIVSWGYSCANDTFPGVKTAVSPYTDWITEVVFS